MSLLNKKLSYQNLKFILCVSILKIFDSLAYAISQLVNFETKLFCNKFFKKVWCFENPISYKYIWAAENKQKILKCNSFQKRF